jgi:RNA polymerase sigma factor (sigma-70 family)
VTGDPPADAVSDTSVRLVAAAADGGVTAREEFARRYAPVVRSYLETRWRGAVDVSQLDDAVQEVFVDCFRRGGALARVDRDRLRRFRAYLYGVTRTVARRIERERHVRRRHLPRGESVVAVAASADESLARVFDRAWATALLRRAARRHEERATDDRARRRVELLRLRFADGMPIRDIATRWGVDPAWLHHEYAVAREEFREALLDVAREEYGKDEVEAECARLLELLA